MELTFTVSARISKPLHEVFEAVADPKKLSGYFTTGGAKGRLETGTTVRWDFHDFPGAFPVEVIKAEQDRQIILQWQANEEGTDEAGSYKTTVTISFEPNGDDSTLVSITENGWRETPAGLKASYGNCQGWSQMLCALKAYLEYGINLREGMYK
jgi:uncharacterized protein YndB with AHSA1/START domain